MIDVRGARRRIFGMACRPPIRGIDMSSSTTSGCSTDMCSLVNAKSGGCAEDCGFCAQSRFAESETPLHAMMDPEQILEHARAAEAAGAHRFCMVTQGQGLSKRDFEKVLEGARLVAEQTNLKRCVSIGHMSLER